MPILTPKKIKHLARYFGILGFFFLLGYGYTSYSSFFLIFLGPPFFITYGLRVYARILTSFIPNEPFYNNLFLLLPVSVIYFGLVGFQIKNILNERGKIRLFVAAAFVGFLIYIHYLSYQELDLYLKGTEKSADLGTAGNLPLGNEQG